MICSKLQGILDALDGALAAVFAKPQTEVRDHAEPGNPPQAFVPVVPHTGFLQQYSESVSQVLVHRPHRKR